MAEELPFSGVKLADFSWVGVGPITAPDLSDRLISRHRMVRQRGKDLMNRATNPIC